MQTKTENNKRIKCHNYIRAFERKFRLNKKVETTGKLTAEEANNRVNEYIYMEKEIEWVFHTCKHCDDPCFIIWPTY